MTNAADLLDWTIADAPDEGEPRPVPAPAGAAATGGRPRPGRTYQAGLVVIALIGLAPLGLWLLPALSWQRAQFELRQIVAAEEQAALAKDPIQYQQFNLASDPHWVRAQSARAQLGWAAPLPIQSLIPTSSAGTIQSIEMFAQDLARVDVARQFTTRNGIRVTFALPQFYQHRDGAWKRTPGPEAFWGDPLKRSRSPLDVLYYPVDAAFVESLIPFLHTALTGACEAWVCPADFKITVNVYSSAAYQMPDTQPALPADDPLLFALFPPHVTRLPGYTVLAPSPHAVGYPVEAQGQDLLKRVIANQVLFAAADQLTFAGDQRGEIGNAYFYALVARMAAHVGADSPQVTRIASANAVFSAGRIWSWRFGVWRRPEDMRSVLVMLNRLLQDQPAEAEIRLFQTLQTAPSLEVWVARALNIPVEAARARIARADPFSTP